MEDEDDRFPDDKDYVPDPSRHQLSVVGTEGTSSCPGFACSFRKQNPRQYCVDNWRPCALTPFQTIARVKYILFVLSRIGKLF